MNEANAKALQDLIDQANKRKAMDQDRVRQAEDEKTAFMAAFKQMAESVVVPTFNDFREALASQNIESHTVMGFYRHDDVDPGPTIPYYRFVFAPKGGREDTGRAIEVTADLGARKAIFQKKTSATVTAWKPEKFGNGSLSSFTEDALNHQLREMLALHLL